jgi:hypothetical protein
MALDMTYVALRPLRVGGQTRQAGELVPEAATWHNVGAYIRGGHISAIPKEVVGEEPDSEETEVEEVDKTLPDSESQPLEEVETEDDLEQYRTSSGWYEVPGADKKMRRDEALEYLTSTEDESEE